jgi:hypothetical protein
MAKSFFRNVTEQITGTNSKTTDIQIVQAISRFEDEHSKLLKFKREFDKYTQAILVFDNASHRFFDFIRSLTDSTWSQKATFVQSCIDMGRIRNEHSQQLHKDINLNINLSSNMFEKMKDRIDDQYRIQHDYDKTRKQYQSSIKRDDQIKIDRIKNDLDQLKSALNLLNSELRDELPKFHLDIQNNYTKIVLELFDIHGKHYKNLQKLCSRSVKKFQSDRLIESNSTENDFRKEPRLSTINSNKTVPYDTPSSTSKQTDYKILHQARVIHDYKAENEDEIDLIKDEYIDVIAFQNEEDNERDKGWEYAEKSDGTTGLFPVNFAVRLYDNEEKQ